MYKTTSRYDVLLQTKKFHFHWEKAFFFAAVAAAVVVVVAVVAVVVYLEPTVCVLELLERVRYTRTTRK